MLSNRIMLTRRFFLSAAVTLSSLGLVLGVITAADNNTCTSSNLQTWWHNTGEINYQTPVQEDNVRQSHVYTTWVKSTADPNET